MTDRNFEEVLSQVGLRLEHILSSLYKNKDRIFSYNPHFTSTEYIGLKPLLTKEIANDEKPEDQLNKVLQLKLQKTTPKQQIDEIEADYEREMKEK